MKKAKFYLLQTNYVGKKLLSTFTQKRVLLTKGSEFSIHSRNFRNTINIVLGDDFPQPLFKTYWTINTYGGQHYPIGNSTCIHISIGKKQYLSVYRRYMPRSSFGNQHHPLFTITIPSFDEQMLNDQLAHNGLTNTAITQLDNGLIYVARQVIALFSNKQNTEFTQRQTDVGNDYETNSTYPDLTELHDWLVQNAVPRQSKK